MVENVVILNNEDFDSNDKFVWDRSMTLALIQEYKRFQQNFKDPSLKKKLIWKNMAACLHARGYTNVTDDACDKKWRNLKKTFKDIYTGQRRKNNGKWAYYDVLEDVLGKDPKILNALIEHTVVDNSPAIPKHPVVHKYKTADGQNVHVKVVDVGEITHLLDGQEACELTDAVQDTEDENSSVEIVCGEYSGDQQIGIEVDQNQQQPPLWFAYFLTEYREREQRHLKLLQSMHEDILAMENKKVTLLEKLLDKFNSSTNQNAQSNNSHIPNVNIMCEDGSNL
ncbi:uncharacterized protein LOC107222064 [Neodiprion lecontei]|uniref:Uncharacterized protein LOC107222064 n=1 Tax=Neodiprion lecontei TaxID=441921 RepID=A0A6J0BR43_NEOLC|nr:uncharacterized protein LOC107222064 [Neodiprion lecontei]